MGSLGTTVEGWIVTPRKADQAMDREILRSGVRGLKSQGLLIASGPCKPHSGGALLLRVPDANAADTLDRIRDQDPFITQRVAQYELLLWDVKTGIEDLDKL
jgi:uncharacterized protein YciI